MDVVLRTRPQYRLVTSTPYRHALSSRTPYRMYNLRTLGRGSRLNVCVVITLARAIYRAPLLFISLFAESRDEFDPERFPTKSK